MTAVAWIGAGIVILLLGVAYWLLISTEGTYLGPRVVALLYDWTAAKYDDIKDVHYVNEAYYIGVPLDRALRNTSAPRVLDIATGTGRVPLACVRNGLADGTIVGIDRSVKMMQEAQEVLRDLDNTVVIQQDASALGFCGESFDAVTCLEALEFMSEPNRVLAEMLRVLKPGGVLLLSNRIGHDARMFPNRLCGRGILEEQLTALGMQDVHMQRWQVHYDLVWARKPAPPKATTNVRKECASP